MPPLRRLRRLKGSGSDLFCATLLCSPLAVSCRWELSDHPRFVITPIDVCVLARSHYRGIYATHGDTTAPHTDRPFDAAEGSTALSSARLFFMRGFVMLAYSAGPFVSVNSFLFYARGLGFITGFEEPDSALLPPSGSLRSSSFQFEAVQSKDQDKVSSDPSWFEEFLRE